MMTIRHSAALLALMIAAAPVAGQSLPPDEEGARARAWTLRRGTASGSTMTLAEAIWYGRGSRTPSAATPRRSSS